MSRNQLDGPAMGYGPLQAAARGGLRGRGDRPRNGAVPRSPLLLALVCVLLGAALAVVLLNRGPSAAGPAVGTPSTATAEPAPTTASSPVATRGSSATTPGTDATERSSEPDGVREAATEFLRAWREPSAEVRIELLSEVATESLTERLTDVDPAKITHARPVGSLVVGQASDYAAIADQKLSDKSTVRMQLVYDPASRFGWLVDTISPLT